MISKQTEQTAIRATIILSANEEQYMRHLRASFPFRKIAAVKTVDGRVEYFARPTLAQANCYARKVAPAAVFIL